MDRIQQDIAVLHRFHPDVAKALFTFLKEQREQSIPPVYYTKTVENIIGLYKREDGNDVLIDECDSSGAAVEPIDWERYESVVLYSMGLGTYVSNLSKYINKIKLVILEPSYDVLLESLQCQDWTGVLSSPNVMFFYGDSALQDYKKFVQQYVCFASLTTKFLPGRALQPDEETVFQQLKKETELVVRESQQRKVEGRDVDPELAGVGLGKAHEILQSVFVREAERENFPLRVSLQTSPIQRFLHDRDVLADTIGYPYPKHLLVFSEKWLLPHEWARLKDLGIERNLWCYDDPYRNESIQDIGERFDRVFCFDPVIAKRLGDETGQTIAYLPGATAFGDGVSQEGEVERDVFDLTFVGSTGLQRYDDRVIQWIRSPQGPFRAIRDYVAQAVRNGSVVDSFALQSLPIQVPGNAGFTRTALLQDLATFAIRAIYLSSLEDFPLSIFGDLCWSERGLVGNIAQHYQGKSLDYLSETPMVYHQSKINLNTFNVQCIDSPTVRMLDVMACGGFLLTEYRPFMDEMFAIGEHLDVFRTPEELKDKIRFYLEHDELRNEIAANGRQLVLKHHCYRHRLREIFDAK